MGGFDDWGELGCGLWGRVFPVEGAGWARPDWKAGGVLDVAVGGAGCRGLSERLYVAPPGEPPRPDELPDQPHPHHSRGDSVHSAQQGAGAGRARCLRQGGVAVCSPRPTRGWVVDGQELRSPQSWRYSGILWCLVHLILQLFENLRVTYILSLNYLSKVNLCKCKALLFYPISGYTLLKN